MDDALRPGAPTTPPELALLDALVSAARPYAQVTTFTGAGPREGSEGLPVHAIALGNPAPHLPGLGIFGGVHGLERIGTRVVLAFLQGLVSRLPWDETLRLQLQRMRLVFMPLVNPGGLVLGTRANPRGVDLMRNAPLDASEPVPFLVGGQRLGPGLPWYRGRAGEPLQPESQALCDTVERELSGRPVSLALDCHSGFGQRDRLWFPFAGRRAPFTHAAQLHALNEIFERSHAHHPYVVEPQSRHYLAHGDLWDHLALRAPPGHVFLPFTLEMGSWLWVKKNPRQLFSRHGIFNPVISHRETRVLRRHLPLLDFLMRATVAAAEWLPRDPLELERHRRAAHARWYAA
ncbi:MULTISPECIES: M14 family zinc carboxypeptidase [Ramlibacter]|uniref:M14 family zinc carboxypeptidase n=1 Tax=Ramlibacter TaxID=174951 RepID=UPI00257E2505|nr:MULTISPECIES: M14 family zinc carboxypeptidase [Ramlibacter]